MVGRCDALSFLFSRAGRKSRAEGKTAESASYYRHFIIRDLGMNLKPAWGKGKAHADEFECNILCMRSTETELPIGRQAKWSFSTFLVFAYVSYF